jgi:hypothetical protein
MADAPRPAIMQANADISTFETLPFKCLDLIQEFFMPPAIDFCTIATPIRRHIKTAQLLQRHAEKINSIRKQVLAVKSAAEALQITTLATFRIRQDRRTVPYPPSRMQTLQGAILNMERRLPQRHILNGLLVSVNLDRTRQHTLAALQLIIDYASTETIAMKATARGHLNLMDTMKAVSEAYIDMHQDMLLMPTRMASLSSNTRLFWPGVRAQLQAAILDPTDSEWVNPYDPPESDDDDWHDRR